MDDDVLVYGNTTFSLSSFGGHLGCLYLLAVADSVAQNIHERVFVWTRFHFSSWVYTRSGSAGSRVNSMFNNLRSCQTICWSGCLVLHPPRQCMKVAICPHPCRPLLLSRFLNYSHPSGCEVVSHYGFALHFPDRWWCWTTFYVLMGHLYNFFGEFLIHHISHLLKFPLSWGKVWYCNKTLYLWLCLHSYHTQSLANHGNISQWLLVLSKYFIYLFIYVFIFCTQSFLSFIFRGLDFHLNTHAF